MAKFYICRRCGNLAGMVRDSGVPMVCCGQKMEELVPNTVEASGGKSTCRSLRWRTARSTSTSAAWTTPWS